MVPITAVGDVMRLFMVLSAVAGLAAALPAAADMPERPDNLDDCLAAAQGMTMDVGFCLDDEAGRSEALVAQAYAAAERVAEEGQKAGLAQSQEDWLKYRETWCATKGAFEGSGSAEYLLRCVIRLNEQRAAELNGMDTP
jgi:uncharacterized protein YecT (DUF1311 family)